MISFSPNFACWLKDSVLSNLLKDLFGVFFMSIFLNHFHRLREKQEEVQEMATLLDERGKEVAHQRKELQVAVIALRGVGGVLWSSHGDLTHHPLLQAVQEENRLLRVQIQEIKQENGKQVFLQITKFTVLKSETLYVLYALCLRSNFE